jgi:hypothetical protein
MKFNVHSVGRESDCTSKCNAMYVLHIGLLVQSLSKGQILKNPRDSEQRPNFLSSTPNGRLSPEFL